MIIFPAIDIQNGECVRLTKGDFSTAERVAEDPIQTALAFKEAGAEWIHMVDLDGAKMAQMQNREVFVSVARETGMKIELGGGIREMKTAEYYLENGIERIILGSIAVKNPKLLAEMVREYGDRIVVGIDADNGLVKIEGWQDSGRVNYITLAREMEYIGVQHVIYTDISRDGTLTGPNLADLRLLRDSVKMNVIASGGISDIKDIVALNNLKLYGAICGKSLYRGTLDLKEAIAAGQAEPEYDPTPIRPAPHPDDVKKTVTFRPNTNRKPASAQTSAKQPDPAVTEASAALEKEALSKQGGAKKNQPKTQQNAPKQNRSKQQGQAKAQNGGAPKQGQKRTNTQNAKKQAGQNNAKQGQTKPQTGAAPAAAKAEGKQGNPNGGQRSRSGRPNNRRYGGNRPKNGAKPSNASKPTDGKEA